MLQSIRDKIQGLVAGIIATIIAITFALWGVQNYLRSDNKQVVAKVNGKEITQEQLRLAYENVKHSEMMRFGSDFLFDQKNQERLKQDILQNLIRQELVFQAELAMRLKVGKQQLGAIVRSMPYLQVNGQFSPDRFQQLMQRLAGQEQTFFDEIARTVLHVQLERGIAKSAFVLPYEVETIKKILKQRRDFSYFLVTPERFVKNIQITDDAINTYYTEHQNEFLLPEKVSIQYIELSSADLPAGIPPTEEQLKQFYQSHNLDVTAKVKQLYEREQLAKAFTETSDKLADLVYTNPDTLEPAAEGLGLKIKDTELVIRAGSKRGILANPKIIKIAFSEQILKQRYNSNLIEIDSGKVVVLRVKEYIPEKVQPLEQVRAVILNKLRTQEAKRRASLFAHELLQALRSSKTEAELIKQYDLVWHRIQGAKFGQSNKDAKLVDAVFGLARPQAKDVSVGLVEHDSDYVILRLDRVYDVTSTQETITEANFFRSLPDILGSFDYQFLLDSFVQQAKIKIFDKVLGKSEKNYETN
ncbi:MAG: SurA N-terminal domain-containing protein [Coxiellaceae bacterium]|jgi:peptidyl-prolyl cis-trans isomerase D|nr:SurA N-terminal domain-containing protein [Coxiellaceae bacterium]